MDCLLSVKWAPTCIHMSQLTKYLNPFLHWVSDGSNLTLRISDRSLQNIIRQRYLQPNLFHIQNVIRSYFKVTFCFFFRCVQMQFNVSTRLHSVNEDWLYPLTCATGEVESIIRSSLDMKRCTTAMKVVIQDIVISRELYAECYTNILSAVIFFTGTGDEREIEYVI